jgi:hypothetical protein
MKQLPLVRSKFSPLGIFKASELAFFSMLVTIKQGDGLVENEVDLLGLTARACFVVSSATTKPEYLCRQPQLLIGRMWKKGDEAWTLILRGAKCR